MAIGQSNNPNFNVQSPTSNQTLVYDSTQQAFVNATNSTSGSVTGASNQGAGQGKIFKQLSGSDLQLRSLTSGAGITITEGTNDITITSSSTVSGATNLGTGTPFFKQLASGSLEFKTLTVGTGLSLANSGTEVSLTVANADIDAGKVGGLQSTAFLQKSDNLASVFIQKQKVIIDIIHQVQIFYQMEILQEILVTTHIDLQTYMPTLFMVQPHRQDK
jgi:hypothetical protein